MDIRHRNPNDTRDRHLLRRLSLKILPEAEPALLDRDLRRTVSTLRSKQRKVHHERTVGVIVSASSSVVVLGIVVGSNVLDTIIVLVDDPSIVTVSGSGARLCSFPISAARSTTDLASSSEHTAGPSKIACLYSVDAE